MNKLIGVIKTENKLTGSLGVRNEINVDIIGTGKLTGITTSENKLTGSLGVRNEINVDIKGSGPRGERGLQGDKGETGPRGEQGIQGIQGLPGIDGINGIDGKNLEFSWDGTQLGIRQEGQSSYQYVNLKGDKGDTGEQGIPGIPGIDGKSLEFLWNDTQLGIRIEGESTYQYVNLKGEKGDTGEQGPRGLQGEQGPKGSQGEIGPNGDKGEQGVPGLDGKSLEFHWNGTQLGIRIEGQSSYQYVNLKGDKGDQGIQGERGPQGMQGEQGIQGEIGPKGDTGDIESLDAQLITDALGYIPLPISNGVLENYREKLVTLSGTSTVINLSLGNVFTHTLSGNTAYSITNAVNGQAHSFTLIIIQTATARTLTFPASVKWQDGEIPDLSTPLKEYELFFTTTNGGGSWRAGLGGVY